MDEVWVDKNLIESEINVLLDKIIEIESKIEVYKIEIIEKEIFIE